MNYLNYIKKSILRKYVMQKITSFTIDHLRLVPGVYVSYKNGDEDIRKIPSIIAGDKEKRAGIVLAKSEIAKKCGVKTAQTINEQIQADIDSQTDLSYIENYAKYQLGMQKPKEEQIKIAAFVDNLFETITNIEKSLS